METVRLFSHASDVQTAYLLITVAWCPCYSYSYSYSYSYCYCYCYCPPGYCPANREAIAFNDMVRNSEQ